jgi:hypothetical protein
MTEHGLLEGSSVAQIRGVATAHSLAATTRPERFCASRSRRLSRGLYL